MSSARGVGTRHSPEAAFRRASALLDHAMPVSLAGLLGSAVVALAGCAASEQTRVTESIAVHCDPAHAVVSGQGLAGPEDITIDWATGSAFVSATDRWHDRPGVSGIFRYDLGSGGTLTRMRVFNADGDVAESFEESLRPHGISLFEGPCSDHSCRAGEPTKRLFVINHRIDPNREARLSEVEIFDIVAADALRHVATVGSELIEGGARRTLDLNDLVAVGSSRFYATDNGHGLLSSSLLAKSAVVHYDGSRYQEVASGLRYANGIAFHPVLKKLYVAASSGQTLHLYDTSDPLRLVEHEEHRIDLGALLDNIEWESPKRDALLIAGHDSAWRFLLHSILKTRKSPSSVRRVALGAEGLPRRGEDAVRLVYRHDAEILPGISVAASRGQRILLGAVFVDRLLDCAYDPGRR